MTKKQVRQTPVSNIGKGYGEQISDLQTRVKKLEKLKHGECNHIDLVNKVLDKRITDLEKRMDGRTQELLT